MGGKVICWTKCDRCGRKIKRFKVFKGKILCYNCFQKKAHILGDFGINGDINDVKTIIKRLIDKYGKDEKIIEVIKKEYGSNEVKLC